MLNKVMIIGRLGRDPEMRQSVCSLSVGTDESYTDREDRLSLSPCAKVS